MWYIPKAAIRAIFYLYVLYTWVLSPTCSLPWVRGSEFCTIIKGRTPEFPGKFLPSPITNKLCQTSFLANFSVCSQFGSGGPSSSQQFNAPDSESIPISGKFHPHPSKLSPVLANTYDSKAFQREADDIISLLGEVYSTLQTHTFCGKDEAMDSLRAIYFFAKTSSFGLQKYRTRLLSSLNIILASTRCTETTARSFSIWRTFRLFFKRFSSRDMGSETYEPTLNDATRHTLDAYSHLEEGLSLLYSDVRENLLTLDAILEFFVDDLYNRSYPNAKEDLAFTSNQLRTRLGWNQPALSEAYGRLYALQQVGAIAKNLRLLVFSVENRLEKIQAIVIELDAVASEANIVDSPIPKKDIVNTLWSIALSLRDEVVI
ncbi:hypothetical protein CVT26_011791 [Gymnopilus dilepis]|uniref:Uncharacterized protein n=1 Tax=Gymnopilus dilepis TaxID=231916 RepID=A0A409WUD5_9AGAR|nr:hypothetical protein CVT26_011791 [Gymnopilus dilepis]